MKIKMNPYDHQQKILDENPDKALIALGTGGGKTRVCLELAMGATLVIAPKQQKLDRTWERNSEKFGIIVNLIVLSKEEFRRDWNILPKFTTVIFDECHTILGVTPETRQKKGIQVPKSSQIFDAANSYLKKYPPERLYLASATPVTKPMHLYAIATLFGNNWDFFRFRQKYYFERKMGYRSVWLPRKDSATKGRLAELVKNFGYTGKLNDWFDVPDQIHEVIPIELTDEQNRAINEIMLSEADPLVKRAKRRTIENGVLYGQSIQEVSTGIDKMQSEIKIFPCKKNEYILEIIKKIPKILIFAAYSAQIKDIASNISDAGYKVLCLTGQTKDRATLMQDAETSKQCIVIAQSSISAGYELPSFSHVIFASKSYRYVDYEQALGRVLRANALKKNTYIHLIISKGVDEDCHNTILLGHDFQEMVMSQ